MRRTAFLSVGSLCWAMGVGCTADLLPGEVVLGDEVGALVASGEAGSRTGAAVAFGESAEAGLLLVGAPGAGEVFAIDERGAELWRVSGPGNLGARVWWREGGFFAWAAGEGVYRVDGAAAVLVEALPDARRVDLCPDGSAFWTQDADEDVACGDGTRLWTSCDQERCSVLLQDESGTQTLDEIAPGGVVTFDAAVACWGDPLLDDDPMDGSAACSDGRRVDGLDGDHVGASLGAGRAGGVFNKWTVPPRLRILPLDGGEAWSVDRAAERSGVALAQDPTGGRVAIGVPGAMETDAEQGRVYVVGP